MNGKELKAYLQNHYDYEAAEIMGCSKSVIYEFRRLLGMPNYRVTRRNRLIKKVRELKAQGLTVREIAKSMGFATKATAYYYLNMEAKE